MERLEFNAKRHHYTLDGRPITGVTTILGVIAKPALIPWASNQAVDHIKEEVDNRMKHAKMAKSKQICISDEWWEELLKAARTAYAKRRDSAGDVGTEVHQWIEGWIKEKHSEFPESAIQARMCKQFVDWAEGNKVQFLASEQQVFSEKFFYAGTFDFLCKIKGKTYLGDVKTGSGIYPEMWAQCAAYQLALQENEEIPIDGHIIVNVKKDGTLISKINHQYINYKKMFLAALVIYRQQRQLKV